MTWLSSSGEGGSWWMNFSVRRTQPMSTESTPSGSAVPNANSVEPPPMSTTRKWLSAIPAAEVDDENGAVGGIERGRRAPEGEASFVVAGQQFGADTDRLGR